VKGVTQTFLQTADSQETAKTFGPALCWNQRCVPRLFPLLSVWLRSTISRSRLGRHRHRPSTSNRSLISWTIPFMLELAVPGDTTWEIPQRRDKSSSEFQSRFLLHQPAQAAPDDGKGQCLGTRLSRQKISLFSPRRPNPPFPLDS